MLTAYRNKQGTFVFIDGELIDSKTHSTTPYKACLYNPSWKDQDGFDAYPVTWGLLRTHWAMNDQDPVEISDDWDAVEPEEDLRVRTCNIHTGPVDGIVKQYMVPQSEIDAEGGLPAVCLHVFVYHEECYLNKERTKTYIVLGPALAHQESPQQAYMDAAEKFLEYLCGDRD